MPVYNGENYLQATLESLLAQTFGDFEIVVADNASTDGTEDIVRELEATDSRIRYFRHESNLGAAPNYNFTLSKARGEFFMWTAHDDLRAPESIGCAVEVFEHLPMASCVFSIAMRIDEMGEQKGQLAMPPELLSEDPSTRFRAAVTCVFPGVILFGLMRRSILEQTGRHGNYPGADRVLAAELAVKGPFAQVDEPLFFSRDHPDRYVRIKDRQGRADQSLWWDASRADVIDLPAWKRYRSYLLAPRRAGLPLREQARCWLALLRATFDNNAGIARQLGGDAVRAAAQLGVRTVSRFRQK